MSFRLTEAFIEPYKLRAVDWGFNGLGYVVYKRTYSENGTEEWWQTCRRVIEGEYSAQAEHCDKNGLPFSMQKAQLSAQKSYDMLFNMKWLPPGRGLQHMGRDVVKIKKAGVLQNCLSGDTEVITSTGIFSIKELAGRTVTILTKGGKWVDAPISCFGEQDLLELTLTRRGIRKSIFCTSNHRWFARKRNSLDNGAYSELLTSELIEGMEIQSVYGQNSPVALCPTGVAAGFTYGDGCRRKGGRNAGSVTLFGKKDGALAKYFHGFPRRDATNSIGGIEIGGIPNFFKDLPDITETRGYLYGWLAGYFAADGTVSKTGVCSISSADRESLEFVRSLCAVLGVGCHEVLREDRVSNLTGEPSVLYSICLMRETLRGEFFLVAEHRRRFAKNPIRRETARWTVVSIRPTDRKEPVYCATVDKYGAFTLAGNILTGNCAFVSTRDISKRGKASEPFALMADLSMLGIGVGSDTAGAGQVTPVRPQPADAAFVVPDSREGWVQAIRIVLDAYLSGGKLPEFDYSQIRPEGTPLSVMGGKASGPGPLIACIKSIGDLLAKVADAGVPLSSGNIVDIHNFIGRCVVSGGIRRTAQIMLGDDGDEEFRLLKDPSVNEAALMSHRWASNNSILADADTDYRRYVESIAQNGEPGFVWLDNCRHFGRMKDGRGDHDPGVCGVNPCGEQPLEHKELCCLVEIPLNRLSSLDELEAALKCAYLYAKSVTLVPTHDPEINAIMGRNRRIGTSVTGVTQAIAKFGYRDLMRALDSGYEYLRKLDRIYSRWLCVPSSIKTSTIKPSGSVSVLSGSSPGMHFPHAEYYVRRIRLDKTSHLVGALTAAGYPREDSKNGDGTIVFSFPVHEENFFRGKADASMREQLELAAQLQYYWSDNAVSATITFKPEEVGDIALALEQYASRLKSISMLPLMDHGYVQAPYEEISRDMYEQMMTEIKPMNLSGSTHEVDDKFCDGDKCVL